MHAGSGGCGGHPTVAVDVVVVAAGMAAGVVYAAIAVVGRHLPCEVGLVYGSLETQVLCRIVGAAAAEQPDTVEVDGHVDLIARIGVPTEEPNLVVGGVDTFHPDVADENIGFYFVVVAAVEHQFVLSVEAAYGALGLAAGEIVDGAGSCG